ncbi:MAG: Gfo/Idh/MocA family oxidoreductase [Pseudomonadota bacterium]
MERTPIALIGAGAIGKRHLEAIGSVSDVALVAICDPSAEAQDTAAAYGVPGFGEFEEMLPAVCPAGVVIASPTEHHLKPALRALEAGAHVLVEKPITATSEEAEELAIAADAASRHVLVGHHRRYYGLVNRARDLIRDGAIGQLVAVSGQWNVRKHDEYYAPDWRKKWQAGPILTNLIHDMDLLRYIVGDVESIIAETSNHIQGHEKEDVAALVARFSGGVLGSFILSDQSHSPWTWEQATGESPLYRKTGENAVRFMGTEGSLEFPSLRLWTTHSGDAHWRNEIVAEDLNQPLEDAFVAQIQHFGDVIKGEAIPRISARDAGATLRATLAVYEAANSGKRVKLDH